MAKKSFNHLPPSTQLLRVGIIFEAVSVVLVILAFIPFPSLTVNAILFYITIIVGSFTSVIAFICAIVGLIRFVRHRIANIVLAAVSVLIRVGIALFPVFLAGTFRCFSAKPQGSSR